jgi:hypothetical protein
MIVNDLGSLDVDIIIDEGPDTINMQGDAMQVLQSLGPQFLQQFPEIAITLAPLPASVKKPMLETITAQKNAPKPPDPKLLAIQAKAQGDAQERQQDAVLEQQKAQREAAQAQQDVVLKQQAADRDFANQVRQQQFDEQARQREVEHDAMLQRMQAQNEAMIERMKASAEIAIAHIQAQAKMAIAADAHEQQMAQAEETAATGISQ